MLDRHNPAQCAKRQRIRQRQSHASRPSGRSPPPRSKTAAECVRRFAPMALRTPISRVRSATDTNMMFMMPMPPTNNDRPVITSPTVADGPVYLLNIVMNCSCWLMAEIVRCRPAPRAAIWRIIPRNSSFASSTFADAVHLDLNTSGVRVSSRCIIAASAR